MRIKLGHCLVASVLVVLSGLTHAQFVASATEQGTDKSVFFSKSPIAEARNGILISRTVGTEKFVYEYKDGLLHAVNDGSGVKVEFLYHRNGKLDRAIYRDGTVHTARYDDSGNMVAVVSSTGRWLRISGSGKSDRALEKTTTEKPSSSEEPSAKNGVSAYKNTEVLPSFNPAGESPIPLLLAVEGWDTGASHTNGCSGDPDDPTRVEPAARSALKSELSARQEKSEPPKTDCIVVPVPGTGESGGGGSGPGGSGGGPIDYGPGGNDGGGGGGIGTLPPGTAPSDPVKRAACMAAGYRAWEQMDTLCDWVPVNEKRVCKETAMRLYEREIAYCNTL